LDGEKSHMGLDFLQKHGGRRLTVDTTLPVPQNYLIDPESDLQEEIDLDLEISSSQWRAFDCANVSDWRPSDWEESPLRFVDGKDVGQTVAWVRSPDEYPVPIRLAQIGSIVMTIIDGELRREYLSLKKVASMVGTSFSESEIAGFSSELESKGISFLLARHEAAFEFEKLRRAAQNRTKDEMIVLEERALLKNHQIPTIVDGRLEAHSSGFDKDKSPVFGVIKTHYRNYLHPAGMQLLYQLKVGQRTPYFKLAPYQRLPLVTWYLKLSDEIGSTPAWGFVRIEASFDWFTNTHKDEHFVNKLSKVVYEYRCKEKSYRRAPVSIHPIVRAEESLASHFQPESKIVSDFYRYTSL
jgi:hypothetical protein